MSPTVKFNAPWGAALTTTTILGAVILLGAPAFAIAKGPSDNFYFISLMILIPLFIFMGAALFAIRGYELTDNKLIIRRLLWNSMISLDNLASATADPKAMSKSVRTFGNGGLFSFSGRFRNERLGPYRAFATDPKKAVVLQFSDRVIVVTPGQPQRFVEQVKLRMPKMSISDKSGRN